MASANTKEIYGSLVFNEHVMKERLPSATYKSLKATLQRGAALSPTIFARVGPVFANPPNRKAGPLF